MREDLTDITVVLDRSGSMSVIRTDTIGGFNTFLADQKKAPGDGLISLVQFDERYEPNYSGVDLKVAVDLSENTYQPRGSTALLDAVGKTIVATGERLSALSEDQRPGKVVFVIITDGAENASKEWNHQQVKTLIEQQTSQYSWQFVFLGANIDAAAVGGSIGIAKGMTLDYGHNSGGTQTAYRVVTRNLSAVRSGKSATLGFSASDKEENAKWIDKK